jgi:long-subunit acyl-CoA synthetase (AMP-forming)/acyl carrier protein
MCEHASLTDVLRRSAETFGQHAAVARAAAAGGGGMTYAELWAAVERGAASLRAMGLVDGDAVLYAVPPSSDWIAGLLAILEARLVAVPERLSRVTFQRLKAAVYETSAEPQPLHPFPGYALEDLLRSQRDAAPWTRPARDDLALLVCTSGATSTSWPRVVELTHGNLLANLESMLAVRRAAPGDAFLSMLPPSHLFELMGGTLGPLACGARIVYPGALLPNRLVAALREDRITYALAVPALLDALFREVRGAIEEAGVIEEAPPGAGPDHAASVLAEMTPERRAAVRDAVRATIGPSLRTLIVGGAALRPSWVEVLAAVGVRLEVGYGLTEASPIVTLGVADEVPRGSVGRPLPGVEVRVGADGELSVRGANVMRGYLDDPEATRVTLEDGWLRTGDVGRVDEQGFVFVTGRIKEAMVAATGETVYPEEIEPCYASPLFAEWCVMPVPDEDGNDVPYLLARPADPNLTQEELTREWSRLRAAAPARLRTAAVIRLNGELLRTATGKVRRRWLGEAHGRFLAKRRAMNELVTRLRGLVGEVTKRDAASLAEDADLVQALGLDSLESLRVLALVEKRFDVRFEDAEIHAIRTLGQLAEAVARRRA